METEHSSEQKRAGRNGQNRSVVGQTPPSDLLAAEPAEAVRALSKTNVAYWKSRLIKRKFTTRTGVIRELPDWHVKLGHNGQQRWVNLGTPNSDAAERKARDTWLKLQAKGWAGVLADRRGVVAFPTVGEYLAAVRAHGGLSDATFEIYAKKLRRIVAGVFGIRSTRERYSYRPGGSDAWRKRVEAVRIHRLTPAALKRWQASYLRASAKNPAQQQRARTTINSLLRAASSLFSARIRKQLPHVTLPDPVPFAEIERPKVRVVSYVSRIEPTLLFQQAERELANPDEAAIAAACRATLEAGEAKRKKKSRRRVVTEKWVASRCEAERVRRREMFLAFCLALFAGLRRDEIDTLTWRQIDFGRKTIHVETTEHGRVKSDRSDRVVDIDDGLAEILQNAMRTSTSGFVIAGRVQPKPEASSYHHYRCDRLFDRLVAWLKAHGVETGNALHTLRKEFGSQINLEHGLFAASNALGHASIQLTKSVYVAKKARATFAVPRGPAVALLEQKGAEA